MKRLNLPGTFAALATVLMLLVLTGCGGRDLTQVPPDFTDPAWYDDFRFDRRAAYDRFDDKVIQLDIRITNIDKTAAGEELTGNTGSQERYLASARFSRAAEISLEDVHVGDLITVKGLFSHMQETSNNYKIYLKDCVFI
jgi:hypothetical protein